MKYLELNSKILFRFPVIQSGNISNFVWFLNLFVFSPLFNKENICGIGWHLVGNSCLKITTAKETYDNAKLSCRNHNAFLASLTTQKKVEFVLKQLRIMQSSQSMVS